MTDFDPNKALDEMTDFLVTGVRTAQRYADFAWTVRELSNHIEAGKPLPRRWAQMQVMTIKLWNPRGLSGEYQVALNQEYRTGIQPSNWMTVSPGPAISDDDQPDLPHSADLMVLIQQTFEAYGDGDGKAALDHLRDGLADLMTDDRASRPSARQQLAWLMWCYREGYTNPADRAVLRNHMADPDDQSHPDDIRDRAALLGMADEILALLGGNS